MRSKVSSADACSRDDGSATAIETDIISMRRPDDTCSMSLGEQALVHRGQLSTVFSQWSTSSEKERIRLLGLKSVKRVGQLLLDH